MPKETIIACSAAIQVRLDILPSDEHKIYTALERCLSVKPTGDDIDGFIKRGMGVPLAFYTANLSAFAGVSPFYVGTVSPTEGTGYLVSVSTDTFLLERLSLPKHEAEDLIPQIVNEDLDAIVGLLVGMLSSCFDDFETRYVDADIESCANVSFHRMMAKGCGECPACTKREEQNDNKH